METTLARLTEASRLNPDRALRTPAKGLAGEDFDALVRTHQRRIYRVVLGLVRDPDAADTLTQECFLRAFRSRQSFRGEASVGTWLVRIAVNLATDHLRNRKNHFWRRLLRWSAAEESVMAAQAVPDPRSSPERQLAAREELEVVWSLAGELPAQQRAVFLLRFGEEMTLEEIAQALGLETGTVKAHLARAIGALRRRSKENQPHARASDR